MDLKEICRSDEWRKVYDRLLNRWSGHLNAMQESKTWEEFIEHRSRMKEVFEVMRLPLDKLPEEDAELYNDKMQRSVKKVVRERFDA